MAADLLRELLQATIASSAAVLLALALRTTLRRRFGARAAYALWLLVPLSTLVLLLPAPVAPAPQSVTPAAADASVSAAPPIIAMFDAGASDTRAARCAWLGAAWVIGGIAALLAFGWQQRRFERGLGRLSPLANGALKAQATAGAPALLGAWRPRIVLPADFEHRYSAAERELILAHEGMHRVRGDAQANALATALRCVFWFNPLLHAAAARFRFDQELACDAAVIARFPHARKTYANAMLKAEFAAFELPLGCHWQSSHPLVERIAQITRPLPGRLRAQLGALAAALSIAAGTFAAWASQPPRSEPAAAAIVAQPAMALHDTATSAAPARDTAAPVEVSGAAVAQASAAPVVAFDAGATPPAAAAVAHRSKTLADGARNAPPAAAPRAGREAAVRAPTIAAPIIDGETLRANAVAQTTRTFVPPRVTQHWRPPYPLDAYNAGAEGEAQVMVSVAADGVLREAHIFRSSHNAALDAASLEAARHYSYAAALKGGAPVDAQAIVAIDWSIHPGVILTVASGLGRDAAEPGLPEQAGPRFMDAQQR